MMVEPGICQLFTVIGKRILQYQASKVSYTKMDTSQSVLYFTFCLKGKKPAAKGLIISEDLQELHIL